MKKHKSASLEIVSDREFHAALQLFLQILHTVQCMASCSGSSEEDEKNRKNANILRTFMFRNEIVSLCHFAFKMFAPGLHSLDFLSDLITFTHTFLEHLEQFSRGKMLTIKTNRKKKAKKQKNKRPGAINATQQD